MGQYYRIAYDDGKLHINDRKVAGKDYMLAKLMEHSYFGNSLMDSMSSVIYKKPTRVIWVGDYANEGDEVSDATSGNVTYDDVWSYGSDLNEVLKPVEFDYRGKYLVNHTKGVYISFDKYLDGENDQEIHPLSILTSIGNGRGGGDYEGSNMDYVGTWAWDEIEIVDDAPGGMKELDIVFNED